MVGPKPRRVLLLLACDALKDPLEAAGFETVRFEDARALVRAAHTTRGRACIVGLDAPGVDDLETFTRRVKREMPFTDVLVWAPDATADQVRHVLTAGAKDILLGAGGGDLVSRLTEVLHRQQYLPKLLEHRESVSREWSFEGLLSRSRKMWDLFETCVRAAATNATVLILGETGTGKELLARAFHRRSERSGDFVALNCSAVQENLLDSELFGHVRGAFTGAIRDKRGRFRAAEGGTLFLDEIGAIPFSAQYRLLRVLQEETVRPLGGEEEIPIDVRVIAATSSSLEDEVTAGRFREDLVYRLDVLRILVPPLRERPEDILFLFGHFSTRLSQQYSLDRPEVTDGFIEALHDYEWPGNVRQLEHFVERLLLTRRQQRLTKEDFDDLVAPLTTGEDAASPAGAVGLQALDLGRTLDATLRRAEEAYLRAALLRTGGRVIEAAKLAGLSRRTMQRKMARHGLPKEEFRTPPEVGQG